MHLEPALKVPGQTLHVGGSGHCHLGWRAHALSTQVEAGVGPLFVQDEHVYHLLHLVVVNHGLSLETDLVWQVEDAHYLGCVVTTKPELPLMNLVRALVWAAGVVVDEG